MKALKRISILECVSLGLHYTVLIILEEAIGEGKEMLNVLYFLYRNVCAPLSAITTTRAPFPIHQKLHSGTVEEN